MGIADGQYREPETALVSVQFAKTIDRPDRRCGHLGGRRALDSEIPKHVGIARHRETVQAVAGCLCFAERNRRGARSGSRRALQDLLKRPDADLIFTYFLLDPNSGSYPDWTVSEELGELNTDRSFELVAERLKSDDMFVREQAAEILAHFKARRECVSLFIDVFEHDKEENVSYQAALAIGENQFAKDAESALVKAVEKRHIAIAATTALAAMNSDAGIKPVIELLQSTSNDENRTHIIESLSRYEKKQIVDAELVEFARVPTVEPDSYAGPQFAHGWDGNIQRAVAASMRHVFQETGKSLGPEPDDYYEEWQDWWNRVKPLLTTDLKLKQPPQKTKQYAETDFGRDANELELKIAVDSETFRLHDPIRLDLILVNHSDKPYRVILPRAPSGWMPTMAYGICLTNGEKTVVEIEPSDFYIGSYSGPPQFETLEPHAEFQSSVCLQEFLRGRIKGIWPEGYYKFKLTFDSGKYAGISPKAEELTGSWTAEPTEFKIEGPERTDPKEIFDLIAKKSGQPFLRWDLTSRDYERRERSRRTLFMYSDKRIQTDNSLPQSVREGNYYIRDRIDRRIVISISCYFAIPSDCATRNNGLSFVQISTFSSWAVAIRCASNQPMPRPYNRRLTIKCKTSP